MDILKKLILLVSILGIAFFVKVKIFPTTQVKVEDNSQIANEEQFNKTQEETPVKDVNVEKVTLFFIGQNANKEDVYKIVKRDYNSEKDGTKLDFVLNELLKGPNVKEKALGIYTEIPSGTKLRSISKINGKLYIDLSSDFEQGGGTDGLYKRLYQLIKTVNKNTTENVYLKIDGKEIDVIGGEGIMINQPLNPHSLDS